MIPFTLKPNSQQSEPQKPTFSIDMAEQIADRAARKAAEEALISRENMERIQMERLQQERLQQERLQQEKQQEYQQNEGYDDSGDVELFDKATANNITKTVRAYESLQRVFSPPPDPTRQAIDGAISNLLSDFVTSKLGGAGATNVVARKPSILMDVLNTSAAHGFGEQLGANLPNVIQALTNSIGQKKTQELVDNLNSKMTSGASGSSGAPSGSANNSGASPDANTEKQKDMVLALDINNPDHVSQYASAMGLSVKAAKGILQAHQDDIRNERKSNIVSGNVSGNEVTQALTILIQEMTGMKETINNLQNKIVTLEGGGKPAGEPHVEVDTDSRWSEEGNAFRPSVDVTSRNVNLFQTPIKVDVDDLRGNADPFFHETKPVAKPAIVMSSVAKPVPKEDVLVEVKGKDGSSSFRMSGEQLTEVATEVVSEIKNEVTTENLEPTKVEETKSEERKPEIRTIKRKILRKEPVSNEKPAEEHYNIDNKLMENTMEK